MTTARSNPFSTIVMVSSGGIFGAAFSAAVLGFVIRNVFRKLRGDPSRASWQGRRGTPRKTRRRREAKTYAPAGLRDMRVTLRVEEGDVVDKHQPVARLRIGSLGDWKTVLAPVNGAVERVLSPSGSQVKGNAPLIRLQARPDARALAVSVGLIEGASEGAIEIAEDVLRLAATSNGALTQPEIAVFCEKDSPKEIHEAISLLVKNGRAKRNGAVFVFPDYA